MISHTLTLLENLASRASSAAPRASMLARLGRRLLLAQLRQFRRGEITLVDVDGSETRFGRCEPDFELSCRLYFDHPQAFADAAFGGTVGAGEAYIRGLWRCDDLTALVRIFVANREQMNAMDSRWSFVRAPLLKLFHGPTATAGKAARTTSPRTTTWVAKAVFSSVSSARCRCC